MCCRTPTNTTSTPTPTEVALELDSLPLHQYTSIHNSILTNITIFVTSLDDGTDRPTILHQSQISFQTKWQLTSHHTTLIPRYYRTALLHPIKRHAVHSYYHFSYRTDKRQYYLPIQCTTVPRYCIRYYDRADIYQYHVPRYYRARCSFFTPTKTAGGMPGTTVLIQYNRYIL